eukprot:3937507-Rhodomonas_salina.1
MTELSWAGAVGQTACLPDQCDNGVPTDSGEIGSYCQFCVDMQPFSKDFTNMYCVDDECKPIHPCTFLCKSGLSQWYECPQCRKPPRFYLKRVLLYNGQKIHDTAVEIMDPILDSPRYYAHPLFRPGTNILFETEKIHNEVEKYIENDNATMWDVAELARRVLQQEQLLALLQSKLQPRRRFTSLRPLPPPIDDPAGV